MTLLLKISLIMQLIERDVALANYDPRLDNIVILGDTRTPEMICCVVNFTLV